MAPTPARIWGILLGASLAGLALGNCGSSDGSTCTGSRTFPISAVDDSSREPLPSPIVALEPNGLMSPSPDPNGAYVFGGQGDVNGTFSPALPCGRWGVHVFVTGYRCQSLVSGNTGSLEVGLLPLDANDTVPTITQATWDDASPKAGAQVTLTVVTQATSAAADDQITGVIVAGTDGSNTRARPLTPVIDAGASDGVTQTWQVKMLLPGTDGTLTYAIVAATADCRASKVLRLPIGVGS